MCVCVRVCVREAACERLEILTCWLFFFYFSVLELLHNIFSTKYIYTLYIYCMFVLYIVVSVEAHMNRDTESSFHSPQQTMAKKKRTSPFGAAPS